jgi:hypothetical protein
MCVAEAMNTLVFVADESGMSMIEGGTVPDVTDNTFELRIGTGGILGGLGFGVSGGASRRSLTMGFAAGQDVPLIKGTGGQKISCPVLKVSHGCRF